MVQSLCCAQQNNKGVRQLIAVLVTLFLFQNFLSIVGLSTIRIVFFFMGIVRAAADVKLFT